MTYHCITVRLVACGYNDSDSVLIYSTTHALKTRKTCSTIPYGCHGWHNEKVELMCAFYTYRDSTAILELSAQALHTYALTTCTNTTWYEYPLHF